MITFLLKNEKNFFNELDNVFESLFDEKLNFYSNLNSDYPLNIDAYDDFLKIEIATVGIDEKDIDITIDENNILRVIYNAPTEENNSSKAIKKLFNGIKKRSFNFAWRIAQKYDLKKLTATLEKGLLTITIPVAENKRPEKVKITVK